MPRSTSALITVPVGFSGELMMTRRAPRMASRATSTVGKKLSSAVVLT